MPPDVPVQGSLGPGKSWMEHFPRTVSKLGRHVATSASSFLISCQGPATDIPRLGTTDPSWTRESGPRRSARRVLAAAAPDPRALTLDGSRDSLGLFPFCKMRLRPFSPSGSTQSLWGLPGRDGLHPPTLLGFSSVSACLRVNRKGRRQLQKAKGGSCPGLGKPAPTPRRWD